MLATAKAKLFSLLVNTEEIVYNGLKAFNTMLPFYISICLRKQHI
jgi:hypothetical protein